MSKKVRLEVMGLSYAQIKSGAYALILAEAAGPRRIPVMIGPAEAQSIALTMERIRPPRPMTHDLFASFVHGFGITLHEVFIYQFEDGVFLSQLTFSDGERTIALDSRTSDAIAIAMRTGAPIFTTPEIMEQTAFVMEVSEPDKDREIDNEAADGAPLYTQESNGSTIDTQESSDTTNESSLRHVRDIPLDRYSVEELERTLQKLIEMEEYEEAAQVNEILKRKKKPQ